MNKYFIPVCILLTCAGCGKEKDPAEYVNPFIGASTSTALAGTYHGLGKTFPGAATPFGMVQVSPQTITGGDNGPGYSDEHRTIEGFAFTQMSGIGWYGDFGNLMTMPGMGALHLIAGREDGSLKGWRSAYDKGTETASAGYYAVTLTDYGIRVEATASPHCGMLRFTYPESDLSRIQIDLARRVGGTSTEQYLKVVDEQTIAGWMRCTPDGGGWGDGNGKGDYTVHFYAVFSKPLKDYGFWSADIPEGWTRKRKDVTSDKYQQRVSESEIKRNVKEMRGKHLGFFTEFPTEEGEQVTMKAGISFVDIEGAARNYRAEIAGKDFDRIRRDAARSWDRELSRIEIKGGSEDERTIFYTSLYHTMIDPRIASDIDGRYVGADGKIHRSRFFDKRTIFSGWDVFRSQFPLQTLINPGMVNDEINSLISIAEQSGKEYFPRWEFLNAYSGCMIGNPAVSVITDAYLKGIRDFDVGKAYSYSKNSLNMFGNGEAGYTPLNVSMTLEYAYFDWCLAQFAAALGHGDDVREYEQKGQNYRNTFDPAAGWFNLRDKDGRFLEWNDSLRTRERYGCEESNLYQQGWFVPHDIPGLVEIIGSREKALQDLSDFFAGAPEDLHWNQYYNHANEPVHLAPFIFNRLGEPWLTQKWTRHICRNAYRNCVEGLVGNDDVGQMSAWYVLAASGIHPSCPGDTRYEITSPVFDEITFRLDKKYFSGKYFNVRAKNNSPENIYIQEASLNGRPYDQCHIDFADIVAGGTLELVMGPNPKTE